jgi:Nnf1
MASFTYEGARAEKLHDSFAAAMDRSLQSITDEKFQSCFDPQLELDQDTLRAVRAYALQTMRTLVLEELSRVSQKRNLRERLNRLDMLVAAHDQEDAGMEQLTHVDFDLPDTPAIAPSVSLAQQRVQLKTAEMERLKEELERANDANAILRREVDGLQEQYAGSVAQVEAVVGEIQLAAAAAQEWQPQLVAQQTV